MKRWGIYEWSVVLCFLVAPLAAISIERLVSDAAPLPEIALKWIVFCGVGLRLGGAGIKQIVQPQFTARAIFGIQDNAALPVIRELGFANLCFSTIAIISLFAPAFRAPAAVAGGLYFGLAGLLHITKPRDSGMEVFAMISDIFIFLVLAILTAIHFVQN